MCGIAGFFTHRPEDHRVWTVFDRMFAATEARGREGSGVFSLPAGRGGILVHKQNLPASALVEVSAYQRIRESRPAAVVGHCRWPTKGSSDNPANLHPFVAGRVVGVHNGVIQNDDELVRGFGLHRGGEVDSEAIFRLIDHYCPRGLGAKGVMGALSEIRGDFAIAFTHTRNAGEIWLARNEWRPLVLVWVPRMETVFFNSEARFIFSALNGAIDALNDRTLSAGVRQWHLPADTGVVIDLEGVKALARGQEWRKAFRRFGVPVRYDRRPRRIWGGRGALGPLFG